MPIAQIENIIRYVTNSESKTTKKSFAKYKDFRCHI